MDSVHGKRESVSALATRRLLSFGRGILVLMVALAACAGPPVYPDHPGAGGSPSDSSTVRAAKRLTIGILQEPESWAPWEGTTTAGGAAQVGFLVKRTLTTLNQNAELEPDLAVELPSLQSDSWRVNPDGTMDQTWRIKPAARWHDGYPVTADDFVFGFEIEVNPGLPRAVSSASLLIASVTALDPQSLAIHFKTSSPLAAPALFFPVPRHILGDVMAAGDPSHFVNHEYWTTGFVGTGPYRLTNWQPGVFQEFTAFPEYVLGSPKIDTIVFRFLGDANTLLANILSGAVDMALPDGLSVEMAAELKRTWAAPGTGNNVALFPDGRFYYMEFQHRAEWARPVAARDPRVRRAFSYTIDKQGVNEVENAGLGFIADSWITPDDPRRAQFNDSIPDWSHDLSLAQRILADAGWQRGPDGILVNGATGERMESEIRVTAGQGHTRAMAVMAEDWRQVGAVVNQVSIPAALVSDGEYRSTFPFAGLSGYPIRYFEWESWRFSCATGAQADTRWNGHRDGYCSQTAEPLIQRLQSTLDANQRTMLQAELMRILLKEDYAGPPIYWQVAPVVFARGVTGPGPIKLGPFGGALRSTANAYLWDKS